MKYERQTVAKVRTRAEEQRWDSYRGLGWLEAEVPVPLTEKRILVGAET
ncbi:hypothetical protein [Streptomyces sp. NPDC005423]